MSGMWRVEEKVIKVVTCSSEKEWAIGGCLSVKTVNLKGQKV
jgi:hypothetical protein